MRSVMIKLISSKTREYFGDASTLHLRPSSLSERGRQLRWDDIYLF